MNQYKYRILKQAQEDSLKAKKYYKKISQTVYENFLDEYKKYTSSLKNIPYRTPIRNKYNILIMDNYPYIFYYTVEEDTKTVIIVAFFNSKQDPKKAPK